MSNDTLSDADMLILRGNLASNDPMQRFRAIHRLANSGVPDISKDLAPFVSDEDEIVRLAAVEAVGKLNYIDAHDSILSATLDPDWKVRLAAVEALCSLGKVSETVINALEVRLRTDICPLVRGYAGQSLACLGQTQLRDEMWAMARDESDEWLHWALLASLATLNDDHAIELMIHSDLENLSDNTRAYLHSRLNDLLDSHPRDERLQRLVRSLD